RRADGSTYDVEVHVQIIETVEKPLLAAIVLDISEKKRAREQIISSIIEGEDRERKRIARELHDGIAQYLSAANMNLEAVKKEIAQLNEKRKTQFSKGLDLLKQSINEIRDISHNLMPKAIEDYGLITAVEAMVENYKNSTDINIHFDNNIQEELLTEQEQLNIYRIIQESLHNAVKYAGCDKISVQLYQEKNIIYLTIEDDGKGIKFYETETDVGLGLKSIRSRTKALSGSIKFDSVSEKGTVITLQVPIVANNKST
ncbi:MAG: sensor histidine kinase, partial [Candidatus Cyclobacteriaceae bacterium M2_1C_046]